MVVTGGVAVDEEKSVAVDPVVAFPSDGETGIGFFEIEFLRIAIPRYPCGEVIDRIEQPCMAGFGREKREGADTDEASVMFRSPALNVVDLFGEAKVLARHRCFAGSPLNRSPAHRCLSCRCEMFPWMRSFSCLAIFSSLYITVNSLNCCD